LGVRGFPSQTGYDGELSEEAAAPLESWVNNHAFVDGNKRVGFAAAHTFLPVNGFDLDVSSKAAGDFMIRTIADGKFRWALPSRLDCSASCASWIDFRAGAPAPYLRFRPFWEDFHR
jgi:hypothetical protein